VKRRYEGTLVNVEDMVANQALSLFGVGLLQWAETTNIKRL
jgi:hypothetical protein